SSWDEQTDHSQARANRRYPGHHRAVKEDARGQIDRHPLPDQRQLDGIESRRSGGRLVDLHHLRGRPPALSGRAVGRGAQADAPHYLPEIAKVRKIVEITGLSYVGDCKMAAMGTRAEIVAHGDFYLCPLSAKQIPEAELDLVLEPVFTGLQPLAEVRLAHADE